MPPWKILAVDDEPSILTVMDQFLSSPACTVETATGGEAAWEMLTSAAEPFHIIILDRLMPGMDGLHLLRRIKGDRRLGGTPVVMQSGAILPEQIAEGIEAGAFYYLTKPYTPQTLQAIVRAVVTDLELRAEVAALTDRYRESLGHLASAHLSFTTPDDVNRVTGMLAALCPDPDTAATGLVELLLNAVEHGNLGITYGEKKQLMYAGGWEEEVQRRLCLPEYRDRTASVVFTRRDGELEFRITDQGGGFDWTRYLDFDPERSLDPNGRGIAMARRHSFAAVEFQGNGNEVVARVRTDVPGATNGVNHKGGRR
jgi:CheY-like chemotaxis protein/anti-sigma regulatory factor (Ser/Thr protein kinase)